MKKILLLIILSLTIFMFSFERVNAEDTINFSCDYSFSTGSGTAKVRLKFSNIDKEYFKTSQLRSEASNSYIKEHIFTYYYSSSTNNFIALGPGKTTKDFVGNPDKKKIKMPDVYQLKSLFNKASTNNTSVVCPSLYRESAATNYNLTNIDGGCNMYDTITGQCVEGEEYTNIKLNLDSTNCYKNATDTAPVQCSEVLKDGLYSEDQIECLYSSNVVNDYFKLVYNKTNNTLVFNPLTNSRGNGYELDPNVKSKTEDGKIFITDPDIIKLFSSVSNNKATCPKDIPCNCKDNIFGTRGNCAIYATESSSTKDKCGKLDNVNGTDIEKLEEYNGEAPKIPDLDISDQDMDCATLLGPNLTKIVHACTTILRIAGAIIAIVNAMIILLPAIIAKDASGLKAAGKKCVSLAIILALVCLLPSLVRLIGNIFEFDISCLV